MTIDWHTVSISYNRMRSMDSNLMWHWLIDELEDGAWKVHLGRTESTVLMFKRGEDAVLFSTTWL